MDTLGKAKKTLIRVEQHAVLVTVITAIVTAICQCA